MRATRFLGTRPGNSPGRKIHGGSLNVAKLAEDFMDKIQMGKSEPAPTSSSKKIMKKFSI